MQTGSRRAEVRRDRRVACNDGHVPLVGSAASRHYNHCVYSLYSLLLLLALVLSAPWWLLEMFRHGKYRAGWRERLGTHS